MDSTQQNTSLYLFGNPALDSTRFRKLNRIFQNPNIASYALAFIGLPVIMFAFEVRKSEIFSLFHTREEVLLIRRIEISNGRLESCDIYFSNAKINYSMSFFTTL